MGRPDSHICKASIADQWDPSLQHIVGKSSLLGHSCWPTTKIRKPKFNANSAYPQSKPKSLLYSMFTSKLINSKYSNFQIDTKNLKKRRRNLRWRAPRNRSAHAPCRFNLHRSDIITDKTYEPIQNLNHNLTIQINKKRWSNQKPRTRVLKRKRETYELRKDSIGDFAEGRRLVRWGGKRSWRFASETERDWMAVILWCEISPFFNPWFLCQIHVAVFVK